MMDSVQRKQLMSDKIIATHSAYYGKVRDYHLGSFIQAVESRLVGSEVPPTTVTSCHLAYRTWTEGSIRKQGWKEVAGGTRGATPCLKVMRSAIHITSLGETYAATELTN